MDEPYALATRKSEFQFLDFSVLSHKLYQKNANSLLSPNYLPEKCQMPNFLLFLGKISAKKLQKNDQNSSQNSAEKSKNRNSELRVAYALIPSKGMRCRLDADLKVVGFFCRNCLNKLIFMAALKTLLSELGVHHGFEVCARVLFPARLKPRGE